MTTNVAVGLALSHPVQARGEELLRLTEDQWFDRKDATVSPLKLVETEVAFANAEGGTLVAGLSGGVVRGTDRWSKHRNELMQAAMNFTVPPINAHDELVECVNELGQLDHLLVIEVEPSERVHANQKDEVFLRVGDENRKLSFRLRQRLLYDKGQAVFEAEPVMDARIEDLDPELLSDYAKAMEHPDVERLMYARSLLTRKGELAGAAVLLFGRHPQAFFPEAYVRVLRYRGRERGAGREQELLHDEKLEGALPHALFRARDLIQQLQPTRRALGGDGRFHEMPLIPEDAWLEGVVNATIHRSYSISGDHTRVEIFSDRIEITSPGRFPGIISLVDPLHVPRFARNPRIARVLSDLAWGQELGEGIRRMFQEMRRAGLADPLYQQENHSVQLTLLALPIDTRVAAMLPKGSQAIVALLRKKGPLGTGEIADYFGISRPTALRRLNALKEAGLLDWTGKTPQDPRAQWRPRE